MTNFTTGMIFRAAILVVAAGAASAQTLNAVIPFKFSAGDAAMPAGTYRISTDRTPAGNPAIYMSTADGHRTVLMMPVASGDPQKTWQAERAPMLSFECTTSRCSLATIWAGESKPAYRMPMRKLGRDEPVHTAVIEMHSQKGE